MIFKGNTRVVTPQFTILVYYFSTAHLNVIITANRPKTGK